MKSFHQFRNDLTEASAFDQLGDFAVADMAKVKDMIGKIARLGPAGKFILQMVTLYLRRKITADQLINALVGMGADTKKLAAIKQVDSKVRGLPMPKKESVELEEGLADNLFIGFAYAFLSSPAWLPAIITILQAVVEAIRGKSIKTSSGRDFGLPSMPNLPQFGSYR